MAARVWDGGGADELWSTSGNWDTGLPAAGDTVTFNGTSAKNCTVDALGTFAGSVTIASGYTGVITQGSINISWGAFSQATGTFTCHASQTYTCTTFSVTGGTFNQGGAFVCTTFGVTSTGVYVGSSATMSTTAVTFSNTANLTATSGTWNLSGSFTQTNTPTFSANGGTINLNASSGGQTINAPAITFNLFTINQTGSASVTVSASTTMPLGSGPTVTPGTGGMSVSGTISGSGTIAYAAPSTGASLVVGATGTISTFTKLAHQDAAVNINAAATIPASFNIDYTITLSSNTIVTFTGGGKSYGVFKRLGSGNNTLAIASSNTFETLQDNAGSVAHTVTFAAGTTQTITTFTVAGSSGKLVTLRSNITNTAWTLTTASGAKTADYVVIQDSTVDASPTWTAGPHSADGGNNTNWIFEAAGGATGVSRSRVFARS